MTSVGIIGSFLIIFGLFFINFSEKLVSDENKRRLSKGKRPMTDEQISKKIKSFRVLGSMMIMAFLIAFIIALVDSYLLTQGR